MNDRERGARAIAEGGGVSYERCPGWWDDRARAALEALMELSDEAAKAGAMTMVRVVDGTDGYTTVTADMNVGEAREVWRAILRHMLEAK